MWMLPPRLLRRTATLPRPSWIGKAVGTLRWKSCKKSWIPRIKEAAQKIAKISDGINAENKIETLVTAKGVGQCLAIVSTDGKKVDVIVDSKDLSDTLILQIKEIAVEQVGCDYKNVTIIQSK